MQRCFVYMSFNGERRPCWVSFSGKINKFRAIDQRGAVRAAPPEAVGRRGLAWPFVLEACAPGKDQRLIDIGRQAGEHAEPELYPSTEEEPEVCQFTPPPLVAQGPRGRTVGLPRVSLTERRERRPRIGRYVHRGVGQGHANCGYRNTGAGRARAEAGSGARVERRGADPVRASPVFFCRTGLLNGGHCVPTTSPRSRWSAGT